jgi:hypothetical protein
MLVGYESVMPPPYSTWTRRGEECVLAASFPLSAVFLIDGTGIILLTLMGVNSYYSNFTISSIVQIWPLIPAAIAGVLG